MIGLSFSEKTISCIVDEKKIDIKKSPLIFELTPKS